MFRTTRLTPDGRAIDFVTKGGDVTAYTSLIAMIPEFGLGLSILVAGDDTAKADITERLIRKLVPAIEELLRNEVRATYAGTYLGWNDGSSLTLEVDDVGPGLLVTEWVSNYTDFLPVYGSLKRMEHRGGNWEARLIPSGMYSAIGRVEWETWRLTVIEEKSSEDIGKVLEDFCIRDVDALMYNGFSIEVFDIGREAAPGMVKQVSWIVSQCLRALFFKALPESTKDDNIEEVLDWRPSQGYLGADQVPLVFR